jgi:hypothetical protein
VNLDRKTCHSVKGLANRRVICTRHTDVPYSLAGARMQKNWQEVVGRMILEARAGNPAIGAYEHVNYML